MRISQGAPGGRKTFLESLRFSGLAGEFLLVLCSAVVGEELAGLWVLGAPVPPCLLTCQGLQRMLSISKTFSLTLHLLPGQCFIVFK